jgi:hypothetical protein
MPNKRWRSPKYLAAVRELPCVACGTSGPNHAHHRTGGGMGLKAPDHDAFSLCSLHHTAGGYGVAIHAGEKEWEANFGSQDDHIKKTQRKLGYDSND